MTTQITDAAGELNRDKCFGPTIVEGLLTALVMRGEDWTQERSIQAA